jgi:hypothetical protein
VAPDKPLFLNDFLIKRAKSGPQRKAHRLRELVTEPSGG